MKIYANQLTANLNKGFTPCFMLFGDEPFQIDDARKKIKAYAKAQGVEEVIRLTQDDQFQWQDLLQHFQTMSLFAEKKLIELELTSNKVGKDGSEILKQVSTELGEETMLVLFGPKLESAQTKSAWFKALDKVGLYVPVYDIDGVHLSKWLQSQLSEKNLRMSPDASQYLLQYTSGNLLATAQELDKLQMAFGNDAVFELSHIQSFVADQSKYNVFQLMDAVWQQKAQQAVTIISRLKAEEFEPNILFWSFQKDLLLIHELQLARQQNSDTKTIFGRYRVWQNKQKQFVNLANMIPFETVNYAMELLGEIDKAIKQFQGRCFYSLFAQLTLVLTGFNQAESLPVDIAEPK